MNVAKAPSALSVQTEVNRSSERLETEIPILFARALRSFTVDFLSVRVNLHFSSFTIKTTPFLFGEISVSLSVRFVNCFFSAAATVSARLPPALKTRFPLIRYGRAWAHYNFEHTVRECNKAFRLIMRRVLRYGNRVIAFFTTRKPSESATKKEPPGLFCSA